MKKKHYQAPEMELMEVKVEKGFAGSGNCAPIDHCQIEGWANEDAIFF